MNSQQTFGERLIKSAEQAVLIARTIYEFPSIERVRWLEAEVERLTDRNELLEMELGVSTDVLPLQLGLTGTEDKFLRLLLGSKNPVMRATALTVLYGNADEPGSNILNVFISKIRKKLDAYGIEITTIWGRGWCLEPDMKSKLRALIAALDTEGRE
jgi:hypothetical protein